MPKYRHAETGALLEVPTPLRSKVWLPIEEPKAEPEPEPVKAPAKKAPAKKKGK